MARVFPSELTCCPNLRWSSTPIPTMLLRHLMQMMTILQKKSLPPNNGVSEFEGERLYSHVSFAAESSTLEATDLGGWGWHTKEKRVSTAASKGSIYIQGKYL